MFLGRQKSYLDRDNKMIRECLDNDFRIKINPKSEYPR